MLATSWTPAKCRSERLWGAGLLRFRRTRGGGGRAGWQEEFRNQVLYIREKSKTKELEKKGAWYTEERMTTSLKMSAPLICNNFMDVFENGRGCALTRSLRKKVVAFCERFPTTLVRRLCLQQTLYNPQILKPCVRGPGSMTQVAKPKSISWRQRRR